jgi:anaphase-promoting complex subunit 8
MLRHLKFRIDEETIQGSNSEGNDEPSKSTYLTDLEEIDSFLDRQLDNLSGINEYVSALVKMQLNKKEEARNLLIRSLNKIPLFWSAWVELLRLVSECGQQPFPYLNQIQNNWAKNFFILTLFIDNVRLSEKVEKLCYEMSCGLVHFFPESTFLKNCLAMFFHNLSDYDNSLEMFFQVLAKDPFRFENMDILSNILYVKEKHNELGKLAIRCFEIDKYSPETCCVLGNYYSLVGEHSQAAAQFQRAIQLDKNFLAGYTLLGSYC